MQQHQHQQLLLTQLSLLLQLLLATSIFGLPTCSLLDLGGCCGHSCQVSTCAALHLVGATLGAEVPTSNNSSSTSTRSTADDTYGWLNRSGWQQVFSSDGGPDAERNGTAACRQYLGTAAAGAGTQAPAYCSWHGVSCNASVFINQSSTNGSPCPAGSTRHAVSSIELVNNRLHVGGQPAKR
jgi:hypothetical protein